MDFATQLKIEQAAYADRWTRHYFLSPSSEDNIRCLLKARNLLSKVTGGIDIAHACAFIAFLFSPYHMATPYRNIESTLWAHRMVQDNVLKIGDNYDTKWAAAYLPFVDYAVTDNPFCRLLNQSGLPEVYNTKVYSHKTLSDLIDRLTTLL